MRTKRTHGLSSGGRLHPLYQILKNIHGRCTYPSATNYSYYGGRGISLCEQWRNDPQSFVDWAMANGWQRGLEVDRIDADGDYCPENCRIVTHRENSQRTRRISTSESQAALVRRLLRSGATINEAARESGVSYMVAYHIKNSGTWANA